MSSEDFNHIERNEKKSGAFTHQFIPRVKKSQMGPDSRLRRDLIEGQFLKLFRLLPHDGNIGGGDHVAADLVPFSKTGENLETVLNRVFNPRSRTASSTMRFGASEYRVNKIEYFSNGCTTGDVLGAQGVRCYCLTSSKKRHHLGKVSVTVTLNGNDVPSAGADQSTFTFKAKQEEDVRIENELENDSFSFDMESLSPRKTPKIGASKTACESSSFGFYYIDHLSEFYRAIGKQMGKSTEYVSQNLKELKTTGGNIQQQELLDIIERVSKFHDPCGFTMLMRFVSVGATNLADLIIRDNFDSLDVVDNFGKTALYWAEYFKMEVLSRRLCSIQRQIFAYKSYHGLGGETIDRKKTISTLEQVLDEGGKLDGTSLFLLGGMYHNGEYVKVDRVKSKDLFARAVRFFNNAQREQRLSARDLCSMGIMYLQGYTFEVDQTRACELLQRAVEKEDAVAMVHLGGCYREGTGVEEQNAGRCVDLLSKAVAIGLPEAMFLLGQMYLSGECVQQRDDEQGFELCFQAAKKGHSWGMCVVGDCYEKGIGGVERSESKLRKWYMKALAVETGNGFSRVTGAMKKWKKKEVLRSKWRKNAASMNLYPCPYDDPLVICLANCRYKIVERAALSLGWKITRTPLSEDDVTWTVTWMDRSTTSKRVRKLRSYQRINHFPRIDCVSRKHKLSRLMKSMHKRFPKDYTFYPASWELPRALKSFHYSVELRKGEDCTYIIKPNAESCSRGIVLTKDPDSVSKYKASICQAYVDNPLLIEGKKFDLRVYCLIRGVDPLDVFMFQEGIVRICAEKYSHPTAENVENKCMHFTNYSLNKKHKDFEPVKKGNYFVGNKRSFEFFRYWIKTEKGRDPDEVFGKIEDLLVKVCLAAQPTLSKQYTKLMTDARGGWNTCFEVLGFDVMFDSRWEPWLLEVNHSPSYKCGTAFDTELKSTLLRETLQLLGIDPSHKSDCLKREKMIEEKVLTGKALDIPEMTSREVEWNNLKRAEEKLAKFYKRIYPTERSKKYKHIEGWDRSSLLSVRYR